jgi:hypothetical protein
MGSKHPGDYDIGYGKPPAHTRWPKGQSGNPRGRPRAGDDLASAVVKAAREKIPVTEHGRTRRRTKLEVAMIQVFNNAARGALPAVRLAVQLVEKSQPKAEPERLKIIITGGLPLEGPEPPHADDGPPERD